MTRRTLRLLALFGLASALTGCPETASCPDGFAMPDGEDECVPVDPADGGPADAEVDAGPCPTACTGATPVCDDESGACVQCTADDASACSGETPVCDAASKTCVGCMGDADCVDPAAARCVSGMCTGCNDSMQCEGISGTEICDPSAGLCVECTETQTGACGANPCTAENRCSAYGTSRSACQPCDTDANCEADHYCVPLTFGGAARGGYCLLDASIAGCDQPLAFGITGRTTLSGVSGMSFCGINETLTTCEAVLALSANRMCPGGMDDECPEGGICRTVEFLSTRCTYRCDATNQCLTSGPGSNCGAAMAGGTEDYCGGRF